MARRVDVEAGLVIGGVVATGLLCWPVWRTLDTQRLAMTGYVGWSFGFPHMALEPEWIAEHTGTSVKRLHQISDPHADHLEGRDPWGTPWIRRGSAVTHSCGPDRIDQGGAGDDVRVYPFWFADVYNGLPLVLFAIAVALGLVYLPARLPRRRAREGPLLALCAGIGAVVGGLLGVLAWATTAPSMPSAAPVVPFAPLVPAPLAAAGTGALLLGGFAVAARLRTGTGASRGLAPEC